MQSLAVHSAVGDWLQTLRFDFTTGNWTMQTQAQAPPRGTPRQGSTLRRNVPPQQNGNRIDRFNNPNTSTFPGTSVNLPRAWRNRIGYATYIQFMQDFGSNRSPEFPNGSNANLNLPGKVPLSVHSPYCPYRSEATAGGTFSFPPRTQPMHAVRRSLIAALDVVRDMNVGITPGTGDRVAIVTFDGYDNFHDARLVHALSADYHGAMQACTTMQAVSDIGRTTAMEVGLIMAREHLKPVSEGGMGRRNSSKVIVLLTDGVPNAWRTNNQQIENYISDHPHADYYGSLYPWYNSALRQAALFYEENSGNNLYPVGIGFGTDYDFMDRLARMAKTDFNGHAMRGSGNPAEYEQILTRIFEDILRRPNSRLVD